MSICAKCLRNLSKYVFVAVIVIVSVIVVLKNINYHCSIATHTYQVIICNCSNIDVVNSSID